ncbi:hypothetical protein NXS13_01320 [Corynebacterium sp. ES2730-CONJ]|uniref:Rv2732c family membrane protein n=1 Tax=Corynebacterium sp. ES2730-CONJ TaxID=2973941 RepID=UPI00216ABE4B|nr:hypothetical protein [Corynebacterium sp. ES2730-CONJ]MCS4531145.1 hypothetical protein [Corynebacterium sp. ES2730-CONJ]
MSAELENLSPAQLALEEREASRIISYRPYGPYLRLAQLFFAVGLLIPHAGDMRGWQVLFLRAPSEGIRIGIAEQVFVIVSALGVLVMGGLLLTTSRTIFGWVAWLLSGVGLVSSVFALWMRLQDKEVGAAPGIGPGFYLEVGSVIFAVVVLSLIVWQRTDRQKEIAQMRAARENLDEVGYAQRQARVNPEPNPLLIDDRRQRASRKRKIRPVDD